MKIKKLILSVLCAFLTTTTVFSNSPREVKAVDYIAVVDLPESQLGINIPGLGTGNLYKIRLGGETGFCLNYYATTMDSYTYTRMDGNLSTLNPMIIKAMNYYLGNQSSINEQLAQAIMWGTIHGQITTLDITDGNASATESFIDKVMLQLQGSVWTAHKRQIDIANSAFPEFSGLSAVQYLMKKINDSGTNTDGMHYYYRDSASQPILTAYRGVPKPVPVTDYVRPVIKISTETVNVNITKSDIDNNSKLEGVEFDFYRDDVKFATKTTDANGIATAISTVNHTGTSDTYTYCTNWDELLDYQKADLTARGIYSSYASAKAAADAQAQSRADALANQSHTYKVIETGSKNGYWLDSGSKTASTTITGSGTANLTLSNKRQVATITLTKQDSETSNPLSGSVYELYARETISHPDGKTGVLYNANDLVATFNSTNASGQAVLNDLYLGKYYVKEKTAPNGYILDGNTYNVDLNYAGQDFQISANSTTVKNAPQKGSASIVKLDSETLQPVANAIFELYADGNIMRPDGTGIAYGDGALIATFPATNSNGVAVLNNLYLGNYEIREKTAPDGYLVNNETHKVSLTYKGQDFTVADTAVAQHSNTVVRGQVDFHKVDKEINDGLVADPLNHQSQGDATVEGALYGLYARNDIVHKDGHTGIINYNTNSGDINQITLLKGTDLVVNNVQATAGTLLATAKTDANGEISFGHLYLGDYYIKEIEPSEGYLLDSTSYGFTLSYNGQTTPLVYSNVLSKEQIKKQAIQIVKISASENNETAEALKGVQFTLIPDKYVEQYGGFDETWEVAKANDGRILSSEWQTITTDQNGYAITKELPYGLYLVRETLVPEEKMEVADFYVEIKEDSRTPQNWIFKNDADYKQQLAMVKMDAESGKVVQLAETTFKIKNLDTGEYVGRWEWSPLPTYKEQWTTTETGAVFLAEPLPVGHYQIEEIHAPSGYIINTTPVKFEVSKKLIGEQVDENGNPIQIGPDGKTVVLTAIVRDIPVKGTITITKRGEVLMGTTTDGSGNIDFTYSLTNLQGATYEIFAYENIMDPSNDGTVLYAKNSLVDTIATGVDGTATATDLPLGSYYLKEKIAPLGMVLNSGWTGYATLTYKDQNTAIIHADPLTMTNDRQKVDIKVVKQDTDTDTYLEGAEFTLYAGQDILSNNGTLLVAKDSPIEVIATNENGRADFKADLPLNKYYIVETKAPIGYATNNTPVEVDATYKGQDISIVSTEKGFKNDITKVEVSKKSITDMSELPGAQLSVYPLDANGQPLLGEVADTWISTNTPHLILGLEINKDYMLRENVAPFDDGYVSSEDVYFHVSDTGGVQKVEMVDDITKIEISKLDSYTNTLIPDATLAIYQVDEDGNIMEDAKVKEWTTGSEEADKFFQIPVGKYALVEVGTPYYLGYTTAEPVFFEIKDTPELQKFKMKDDHTKVDFTKTDITTGGLVQDAVLTIYPLDENGEPKLGEAFDTWMTADSEHRVEYLPVGEYILRETTTPFSNGYITAEDVKFTVEDTSEIQKVEMKDDHTRVEVSKVDVQGNLVPGAVLQVVPVNEDGTLNEGEAFTTFISNASPQLIEYLPIGKYVLRELKAPEGYVKASDVEFEVENTADVQKVQITNKQVLVSKTDVAREEIEGAEMHVLDKDGNVVDSWTSSDKPHTISGLAIGETYTLVEDLAPVGFVIANTIEFTVEDNGENQKIDMVDKVVSVNKLDANGAYVEGAKLQVVSMKTKEIVDEWITGKEAHKIENLVVDASYILREIETPEGYVSAKDLEFTVTDDNENQELKMIDKQVIIHKKDNKGNYVVGAKLQVVDMSGKVIDEWTTDKSGHAVSGLELGKEYILKEVFVPSGYIQADDMKFSVSDNSENQEYVMTDKLIPIDTGVDNSMRTFSCVSLGMLLVLIALWLLKQSKNKKIAYVSDEHENIVLPTVNEVHNKEAIEISPTTNENQFCGEETKDPPGKEPPKPTGKLE